MTSYRSMFSLCCQQLVSALHSSASINMTKIEYACHQVTRTVYNNHTFSGVLDFENMAPVKEAWWINGLFPTLFTFLTIFLNFISVIVFIDVGHRSPTNALLATISAVDLLTCITQAPLTFYVYLLEGYEVLPTRFWCDEYNYFQSFIPASLHSMAILLNMGVSIQRCIGVRNIRRLKSICSYKGTLVIVLFSSFLSVCVHSIYLVTFHVEEVSALSKQMLATGELRAVRSCRIFPRYLESYLKLYSVYLWCRIILLQVLPALVLCVCNVSLIMVSCRTYRYRRQLIGSMGILAHSNPAFVPESSATDKTFCLSESQFSNVAEESINSSSPNDISVPETLHSLTGNSTSAHHTHENLKHVHEETPSLEESAMSCNRQYSTNGSEGIIFLTKKQNEQKFIYFVCHGEEMFTNGHKMNNCALEEASLSSMKETEDSSNANELSKSGGFHKHDRWNSETLQIRPVALEQAEKFHRQNPYYDEREDLSTNCYLETGCHGRVRKSRSYSLNKSGNICGHRVHQGEGIRRRCSDVGYTSLQQSTSSSMEHERYADINKQSSDASTATPCNKCQQTTDARGSSIGLFSQQTIPVLESGHKRKADIDKHSSQFCRQRYSAYDSENKQDTYTTKQFTGSSQHQSKRINEERQLKNDTSKHSMEVCLQQAPANYSENVQEKYSNELTVNVSCLQSEDNGKVACRQSSSTPTENVQTIKSPNEGSADVSCHHSQPDVNDHNIPNSFSRDVTIKTNRSAHCPNERSSEGSAMAELRPSIMLVLVTSCTVLAELVVTLALVLTFLNSVAYTQSNVVSNEFLSSYVMSSNLLTIFTLPLNFLFFYGLSRQFRLTMKTKAQKLWGCVSKLRRR